MAESAGIEEEDSQEKGDPRATNPVGNALEALVEELRGLREMMPVLATTARTSERSARQRTQNVLQGSPTRPFLEDERVESIPGRHRMQDRLRTDLLEPRVSARGWLYAARDLTSAVLLMMSAHFDRFVGDMVKAAVEIKPPLRRALKREVPFSDLADLPDMNAVFDLVVEKEIEQLLRDSRRAQVKWFESRCGMRPLDREVAAELSDVAELRNLIAHHGGQVTNRVGFGWRNRKTPLLRRYRAGERITITADDIAVIHDVLFVTAVAIAQGVWRSLRPDDCESADMDLQELIYSRLSLGEYTLAQAGLLVTRPMSDTMGETTRLVNTINLAQSYRWLGDPVGCEKVLATEQWEEHDSAFGFSAAVLRDEWDLAAELMDECIQKREIDKAEFENWPVLQEFRGSDHYRRVFERTYGS